MDLDPEIDELPPDWDEPVGEDEPGWEEDDACADDELTWSYLYSGAVWPDGLRLDELPALEMRLRRAGSMSDSLSEPD